MKWFELMASAEEISRQHTIDSVVWLHRSTVKRDRTGEEKYKLHNLRRKRAPGNVTMEPSPVLKEMKGLKQGLMVNGVKEVLLDP